MSDQSASLIEPLQPGGQDRDVLLNRGVNKGQSVNIFTYASCATPPAVRVTRFSHPGYRGSIKTASHRGVVR